MLSGVPALLFSSSVRGFHGATYADICYPFGRAVVKDDHKESFQKWVLVGVLDESFWGGGQGVEGIRYAGRDIFAKFTISPKSNQRQSIR